MNPNHYLAVAIAYLFGGARRLAGGRGRRQDARLEQHDRPRRGRPRPPLVEVPVGFKWFVDGLLDGSLGFGGEESAGASFLRLDGARRGRPTRTASSSTCSRPRSPRAPGAIPASLRRADRALRRAGLPAHRRAGLARAEGRAREALARRRQATSSPASRSRDPHRGAGNGAPIGGVKVVDRARLVRRASVRHGGRLQALRREPPGRGAPRADPRGGPAGRRCRRRSGCGGRACDERDVFAIVLAGGEGKRLAPLTADRAKPAVPFGGNYRLVDFALSNLVNAGYRAVAVLTQYKSHSLDRHIATTWRMSPLLGNYVTPVPAQMRRGPRWFVGSADAIFQNFNLIYDERPDHISCSAPTTSTAWIRGRWSSSTSSSGRGVTVAGDPRAATRPTSSASSSPPPTAAIAASARSPTTPKGLPDAPDEVFASMGNYVFSTKTLIEAVTRDAADENSLHDIGGDIIPMLVEPGEADVYDFAANEVPGSTERDRGYWRDVGTLDAYYDAHMDLISRQPDLQPLQPGLADPHLAGPLPPAKFVFDEPGPPGLRPSTR